MTYPHFESLCDDDKAKCEPLWIGVNALHHLGYFSRHTVRQMSPESRRAYDRIQRQAWARGKRIA